MALALALALTNMILHLPLIIDIVRPAENITNTNTTHTQYKIQNLLY